MLQGDPLCPPRHQLVVRAAGVAVEAVDQEQVARAGQPQDVDRQCPRVVLGAVDTGGGQGLRRVSQQGLQPGHDSPFSAAAWSASTSD